MPRDCARRITLRQHSPTIVRIIGIAGLVVASSRAVAAQESRAESQSTWTREPGEVRPTSTWKGALTDSIRLLVLEHATRIALQPRTRRELGGPFVADYIHSLKVPKTWGDGDSWDINYIGHPIHGAAAGFIWLDHEAGAHDPDRGFSKSYWASRSRAFVWATAYSVQFEFGPMSEASIGNVGLRRNTTGWVDHIVTPAGAFGLMVAEDALDRYLVMRIESRTRNQLVRSLARMALNPSRTMSNAAQGRAPWARPFRPLQGRESRKGSSEDAEQLQKGRQNELRCP